MFANQQLCNNCACFLPVHLLDIFAHFYLMQQGTRMARMSKIPLK